MKRFRSFGAPPAAAKTIVSDFVANTLGGLTWAPTTSTTSGANDGVAVDMNGGLGLCCVIQAVTVNSGISPTAFTKVQESDDGSTNWTDISGTTLTTVTPGNSPTYQMKTFARTKRYLRARVTLGGSSPNATFSVLVLQATQ